MPGANCSGIDAERFAALWAGLDTGNGSEAEAVSKFRALRRMVVAENVRIIDLICRADVMAALDAQLQLTREESPELKEAFAKITELADALAREREITAELRGQIDDLLLAGNETAPSPHIMAAPRGSDGLMNGGLVAAVSVVAVALMIAAAFQ
jgi:hypothetical protein